MLLKPINTSEGLIPIQSQNDTGATSQDGQKGRCLTHPTPARQDVPFRHSHSEETPAGVSFGYVEDCFKGERSLGVSWRAGVGWVS